MGMYGLPQAGILANKYLKKNLAKDGYLDLPHTPGLWKHKTRDIAFSLVVDDFGIKYTRKEDADHLIEAIKKSYHMSVDWKGELYCGITLEWNYEKGYVDISMPGYVKKQLTKYGHPTPKRPQHCPYSPAPMKYGKAAQEMPAPDSSPPLDEKGKKRIQQIVGSFQYYARATDTTIPLALSEIATQQSKATKRTEERAHQFLDYMATHPEAKIRYWASDMVLNVHSDASYLTAPNGRSRAGGHFFLGLFAPRRRPHQVERRHPLPRDGAKMRRGVGG